MTVMITDPPSADQTHTSNPFLVESTVPRVPVSRRKHAIAVAIGFVVGVGSFAIIAALLFGIVVAIAGKTMPPPLYVGAFLSSVPGRRFFAIMISALPISLMLGLFCYSRVMRAHRLMLEAALRRDELRKQLASLRKATIEE
jgi:hypothetical protein